jgi:spore germination cell wall hydrolase CwlJ-like protein
MKTILIGSGIAALLVAAVHAQGGSGDAPSPAPAVPAPPVAWTEFARPSFADAPASRPPTAAPVPDAQAPASAAEPDVVDAHWMALTMWGEARGQGEEGMRAVGHVIDNRRRSGLHGSYATEAVSEAFQFSCWNPNDPNRAAMMNVLDLPAESHDGRMWRAARGLAEQILAGRSVDPTGGALFYHSIAVAPRWSQGMPPVARIGDHIFFRTARRA